MERSDSPSAAPPQHLLPAELAPRPRDPLSPERRVPVTTEIDEFDESHLIRGYD
ncbi:hypothetical protein A8924_3978 [Saccharopolyspora erythraea NRRL 2338]|uniref:Uncharacterized protein n=1 Tax=Saccharopolyspora erythraea TaxID=1836 RepID=A0ABN1DUQ4_SACER|nr:hypothetical protein [Saccharopolyspora erythraea]PFG96578.1 hypothetical protein A8924_3978 [Saccharopolyspora erythraea NRRL 2338]QRK94087.1 hypothetical protein JQX30_18315 [Saccharopolyspora erythraea]